MIIVKPLEAENTNHLQEMAKTRDEISRTLNMYESARFVHLLKIFYFRECTHYLRGWMNTVYKSSFSVQKWKPTKKYPNAQMIFDIIWGDSEDSFTDHHTGLVADFNYKGNPDYTDLPYIKGNERSALAFIRDYFLWLSRQLAKDGKVTFPEVIDALNNALRKYPVE
jgi:hypothetical protein